MISDHSRFQAASGTRFPALQEKFFISRFFCKCGRAESKTLLPSKTGLNRCQREGHPHWLDSGAQQMPNSAERSNACNAAAGN